MISLAVLLVLWSVALGLALRHWIPHGPESGQAPVASEHRRVIGVRSLGETGPDSPERNPRTGDICIRVGPTWVGICTILPDGAQSDWHVLGDAPAWLGSTPWAPADDGTEVAVIWLRPPNFSEAK